MRIQNNENSLLLCGKKQWPVNKRRNNRLAHTYQWGIRANTVDAYLRICIRVYAYWADAYYAYILVRIYLSCTVCAQYDSMKGNNTGFITRGTETGFLNQFPGHLNLLLSTKLMWTQSWDTDRSIWKTLTEKKQASDFCNMHKGWVKW